MRTIYSNIPQIIFIFCVSIRTKNDKYERFNGYENVRNYLQIQQLFASIVHLAKQLDLKHVKDTTIQYGDEVMQTLLYDHRRLFCCLFLLDTAAPLLVTNKSLHNSIAILYCIYIL